MRCEEIISFATSAVRDVANASDALVHVENEAGIKLWILSGEDETRLIFLAVRRWYGWPVGRLTNLDISGGSLGLTSGIDEDPEAAYLLLLDMGCLAYEWFETDPPECKKIDLLRDYTDAELAEPVHHLRTLGESGLAVATLETSRTLVHLTGAASLATNPWVKRTLTTAGLRQLIAFVSCTTATDRAKLEGVSANRSHQIVAGALVTEASTRALGLEKVEIYPWALREGTTF